MRGARIRRAVSILASGCMCARWRQQRLKSELAMLAAARFRLLLKWLLPSTLFLLLTILHQQAFRPSIVFATSRACGYLQSLQTEWRKL